MHNRQQQKERSKRQQALGIRHSEAIADCGTAQLRAPRKSECYFTLVDGGGGGRLGATQCNSAFALDSELGVCRQLK